MKKKVNKLKMTDFECLTIQRLDETQTNLAGNRETRWRWVCDCEVIPVKVLNGVASHVATLSLSQ